MIQLGLKKIGDTFKSYIAWIAESNVPSIKTAIALNFTASETSEYRQLAQSSVAVKFIKYILHNERHTYEP